MSELSIPVKLGAPQWNHWVSFYRYCDSYKPRASWQDETNIIARKLKKFNGTLVYKTANPPGIIGLKFDTMDDLLIFKLTFN